MVDVAENNDLTHHNTLEDTRSNADVVPDRYKTWLTNNHQFHIAVEKRFSFILLHNNTRIISSWNWKYLLIVSDGHAHASGCSVLTLSAFTWKNAGLNV